MSLGPLIRTFFRSSRSQPLRTGLMIFGIALGVAGVIAIDIARTSVSRSFELSTSSLTARATHQILGNDFSLPQSLFTRLRTGPGIRKSAPVISRQVKVAELDGRTLRLLGIDPFSETYFRDLKLISLDPEETGQIRRVMIQGAGLIMARDLAKAHGLSLGDGLTLVLGERQVRTRIGALAETGQTNRFMEGVIVADIGLAQELLEMGDRITRIDLILDSPEEIDAVKKILGPGQVLVDTDQQNQTLRNLSQSFETSLTAFSVLVLFMGIFLIHNTVSFSVVRRRPLNATFRALGATRKDIFLAVEAEIMTFALVGSLLGILLGILLGRGAVQAVCSTVSDMYYTLTVSQTHIPMYVLAKGAATGILASFASSLVPALNSAHTRPITLMQPSSSESRLDRHIPWLTAAGLSMLAGAFILFRQKGEDLGLIFMGVFLVFGSASFLAPVLIKGLARLMSRLVTRLEKRSALSKGASLHWTMARMGIGNVRRSLSRTSVLIASLMVVISVYIGIDTMTYSFRESIIQWVDGNIGGDIHISSLDELHPALDRRLPEKIQAMEGVDRVSSYNIHKSFSSKSGQVHIFSYIEDTSIKEWTWLDPKAGTGAKKKIDALLVKGWILVSEIFARNHGLSPGDSEKKEVRVVMETLNGPVPFRVAGIFRDFFMGGGRAVVSREMMKTNWGKDEITSIQVFLKKSFQKEGPAAVRAMFPEIRGAVSDPSLLRIRSGPEIKSRILAVFDNTFLITTALQLLTALVALTGIINSVMALILERGRELGILRACGAEGFQIRTMVLWECGTSGFMAGLLAIPMGLFLSWVLVDVVNYRAFGWTYEIEIPLVTLVLALGFSGLTALGAGLIPAVKAGQIGVADALRTE
ncbi:FtsX-like permease family protein [Desulfospira joergensenii]|uniref:FtsX-like permease family protein n=1 Tax=Desulfospira joergensenii TaxID=53329 RepID=UPI0003B31EDE|nr:FtsX-like permease family protein [Desulfospira joergensenii]